MTNYSSKAIAEFDLEKWAKSEAERCCDSSYEHEAAINWMLGGFSKALDLVMEEIYSEGYNDRGFITLGESELQAIISKLRGNNLKEEK